MAKAPQRRGFFVVVNTCCGFRGRCPRLRIVANGKSEAFSEDRESPSRLRGQHLAMSVSHAKDAWEVRWKDGTGRQRAKRFHEATVAIAFDESIRELAPGERARGRHGQAGGVYSYSTRVGTRWRYVARRSDGSSTSKRGFTSESAARDARRRIVEQVARREVVHTRRTFGEFWAVWLERRRPYLEAGTYGAYERDGRLRLLPALAEVPLPRLDVECVRELMGRWAEAVEAGALAAKTVNNTLGTLVVCLNAAAEDGLIATNPALRVPRLPSGHHERDYLRLEEIPRYLDACSEVYRPLAHTLIGAGLRISEALALTLGDLELESTGGVIVVCRSTKAAGTGSTKSDRFRAVEVARDLTTTLGEHVERRKREGATGRAALLFAMPTRRRKAEQGRWEGHGAGGPIDRTTVSRDWHKAGLQDAALRDMPLHALRHTAAAAWLAAGNSLFYVQRQLGHSDIATSERYYGHLERHILAAGAIATERAIAQATSRA
jgi:integrase